LVCDEDTRDSSRLTTAAALRTLPLVPFDGDSTQTSRARLLAAGKWLFAKHGYEKTSTVSLAREAGTSESQLMRYFGGKSGLLDAIFNEAWSGLNVEIRRHVTEAQHGRDAVLGILQTVVEAFGRDHDIAFLFLFEGRRVRGDEVTLSKGFLEFYELLHHLVGRGQLDGSFRSDVSEVVLASAMLGCAEGMIRDRMIAERVKQPNVFDDETVRRTFEAMVNGLAPQ
jgi:AcrR family transcriptional regulator